MSIKDKDKGAYLWDNNLVLLPIPLSSWMYGCQKVIKIFYIKFYM